MKRIVFTIGHSNHPIEKVLSLLALHQINAVADVRSSPFSRINPQFNREEFQKALNDAEVRYVFLGKELGARSDDPTCYENDKIQYQRLAKTKQFQSGLERIIEGASSYRVALMCVEKNPLHCHRTILVARELAKQGLGVMHILADGSLETHEDCINRLLTELGMSAEDIFLSRVQIEDVAYTKQAEKIAYVRNGHHSKAIAGIIDSDQTGADG